MVIKTMLPLEARQLRTFRKEEGLSQKELAEEIGVGQDKISKYESGALEIPYEIIKHLHLKYNMSYEWFFHRRGRRVLNEKEKPTLLTDIAAVKEDNKFLIAKVAKLEKDIRLLASKLGGMDQ